METKPERPMSGRTVLITGGTAGIGKATALGLARLGAQVAITGRDRGRAEDAVREIRAAAGGRVTAFVADLSSQAEVRRLAGEALLALPRIDVLVNNVGGYWNTRHLTADGLERTFALNHLAPFLLTNLLLDRLRRSGPARVVTVSSNAQAMGRIRFVNTSFGGEDPAGAQRLLIPLLRPFMKTPAAGAAASIQVASAPGLAGSTGQFFAGGRPRPSSPRSYDEATASRLWRESAHLVGLGAD